MADIDPFAIPSVLLVGTCIAWEYQLPAVDGWAEEITTQLKKGTTQAALDAAVEMSFVFLGDIGASHKKAQVDRTQFGRPDRQPRRVKITIECTTHAYLEDVAAVVRRLLPVTRSYWVDDRGLPVFDTDVTFLMSQPLLAAEAAAK